MMRLMLSLILAGGCVLAHAQQTSTHQYEYDANGNLKRAIDPRLKATDHSYDALNRLIQTQLPIPTAGASRPTIAYGYNSQDQLIQVTDPKHLNTSYTPDSFGQATTQVSPDTGTTTNSYDEAGNLKSRTDARGIKISYTYDAANRLSKITYGSGGTATTTTFTYDTGANAIGRRTRMQDSSVDTQWEYTPHGRLALKRQLQGSRSFNVGYAYDSGGRLQDLNYPSGNKVSHSYDAAGRLSSLSVQGTATKPLYTVSQYQPFGAPTQMSYGNGQTRSQSYDLDGRLIAYSYDSDFRILSHDDAGRIISISPTNPAQAQTYAYDDNDRLTGWNAPSTNQSYAYDLSGDRTQITIGANSYTYTLPATSHQLASTTGPTPRTNSYDAMGNLSSDGTISYTYNNAGRLSTVTVGGTTTSYALNGLGQRVKKVTGASTTHFVYDDAGQLLGEYDAAGAIVNEYVWAAGQLVAILKGTEPKVYSVETDQLGAPRLVRDEARTIRWTWEPDPFGVSPPNNNPGGLGAFTLNLRFPGQYFDAESNLHYNYLRDGYDAQLGRYTQFDPIGLAGGINGYAYVGGNPVSKTDPTGLRSVLGVYIGAVCIALTGATTVDDMNSLAETLEAINAANDKIKKLEDEKNSCKDASRKSIIDTQIDELRRQVAMNETKKAAIGAKTAGLMGIGGVICVTLAVAL